MKLEISRICSFSIQAIAKVCRKVFSHQRIFFTGMKGQERDQKEGSRC
jgi:hypothetical protein